MNQSLELATEVNTLLGEYIAIHDDILGSTLRKIIPIPGIFKEIDFCGHEGRLATLAKNLAKALDRIPNLRASTSNHDRFLGALGQYAVALLATIQKLQAIASNLCRKSRGARDYKMPIYRKDVDAYNAAVRTYVGLGQDLNELLPVIGD